VSRILCAWELGGGAGHLHHLAVISDALRRRDHEVTIAARDLVTAARFAPLAGFPLLQAPLHMRGSRLPSAINYAELLNRIGYLDAGVLFRLVEAWRGLIRMARPDLVVAEHSPTALIAARLEGARRVTLGTGFEQPPRLAPMPTIQPWRAVEYADLARAENQVLERVNAVIVRHGGTALSALHEMFEVTESFLLTLAEFDHYGARDGAPYWGPLNLTRAGGEPEWPPGEGGRVFVYYRVAYPHFADTMRQLAALGLPTLVVADDAGPAHIRELGTERLRITTEPQNLGSVARQAAVAVCHGGAGTSMQLVLGGCPLVVLPVMVEQAQCGYRLARAGLAVGAQAKDGVRDAAAAVRRVVGEPAYAGRARAVAARYAGLDPTAQALRIAERCERAAAS